MGHSCVDTLQTAGQEPFGFNSKALCYQRLVTKTQLVPISVVEFMETANNNTIWQTENGILGPTK